ncbi:MAG: efflux RND transporter periplasmic adaptor subunit [Polyangiaceae bacterium]
MNANAKTSARRWLGSGVFAAALLIPAIVFRAQLGAWFGAKSAPSEASSALSASASAQHEHGDEIAHYTCSMHPSVKQRGPGKCPICGMALVPVTKAQQQQGVVLIDDARRQLIGVRTGRVTDAVMQRTLRAVGHVTYDESAMTDVNLKVRGWITKLFVSQTGQRVKRGQPLFLLYSPELYSAEQDFLLATRPAQRPASARARVAWKC